MNVDNREGLARGVTEQDGEVTKDERVNHGISWELSQSSSTVERHM